MKARSTRLARWLSGSLVASTALLVASSASAVEAATEQEIHDAIQSAQAGTVIHVKKGKYKFTSAIWTAAAGAAGSPITLTADAVGDVELDFDSEEGLVIDHPYWIVEHVWINGVCPGACGGGSAGLHIKATADHLIARGSRFSNFGEIIKSDRTPTSEVSDASILGNELYNDSPELTDGGTAIDLVGGKRWIVAGNYVHDYARDGVHYGIFLKGGTSDGVVERNLVIGAKVLPPGAGAAVGISFGGGGTGPQYCATDNMDASYCTCEDFRGIARNNIIVNTSDAGLHTKRACGSKFENNTVFGAGIGLQIQIEGPMAPVELHNSILNGSTSGKLLASDNLLGVSPADFKKIYADPDALDFSQGSDPSAALHKGPSLPDVTDDYFGAPRGVMNTWGAVELPAAGNVWPWSFSGGMGAGGAGGGAAAGAGGGSASETTTVGAGTGSGTSGVGGGAPGDQASGGTDGCGCRVGARGEAPSWIVLALIPWMVRRRRG